MIARTLRGTLMKLHCLFLLSLVALSAPVLADIPDVDSSRWSTDPRQYGMSPRDYIQSESRAFMANFLDRSGINKFHHFQGLTKAADHWVVSPNNDTIYSMAVVNASQGFTLKLPEVGDRFLATQIVTENHMTPFYVYGGGVHKFAAKDFDTKFVAVGVRIGTTGTPDDVKTIVEKLQPQYAIEDAATDASLPKVDMATLAKVRAALIKEYSKLPNSFNTMVKHTQDVKDWERFTYVTAGAWGLSEDANAMYAIGGPKDAQGGKCYKATFPKVPAKHFFSITVYGSDNYLMTDADNSVGSNRGVKLNKDGSFEVVFGGEQHRKLAPNYLATPEKGWGILLRAYGPDVEAFRKYKMPEIVMMPQLDSGTGKLVTDENFVVAETDKYMSDLAAAKPVNTFRHARQTSNKDNQFVIRENQDILYSHALVDVSKGATLVNPDWDVYSIIQVIDENQYTIGAVYPGETFTITPDMVALGSHVFLNMRTGFRSLDEAGVAEAHKHQDAVQIKANSAKPYVPKGFDTASLDATRKRLIDRQAEITDISKAFGKKEDVDPTQFLLAAAAGWAGLPVKDAMYVSNIYPPKEVADGAPAAMTLKLPPLQFDKGGFFSVTTYDRTGWIVEDKFALNNRQATPNADGSITFHYNSPGKPNNLTVKKDWTQVIRLYRPTSVEAITAYARDLQKNVKVEVVK